ncbi:hypothetical protein [Hutsoniella sourekii]|uniref:hypothetical protein n=1 Tax=Hutsoniella sourekii TaxID=87650 RepID=UPI000487869D|nr:hypothetical protein [Hutsoniella sourekii]
MAKQLIKFGSLLLVSTSFLLTPISGFDPLISHSQVLAQDYQEGLDWPLPEKVSTIDLHQEWTEVLDQLPEESSWGLDDLRPYFADLTFDEEDMHPMIPALLDRLKEDSSPNQGKLLKRVYSHSFILEDEWDLSPKELAWVNYIRSLCYLAMDVYARNQPQDPQNPAQVKKDWSQSLSEVSQANWSPEELAANQALAQTVGIVPEIQGHLAWVEDEGLPGYLIKSAATLPIPIGDESPRFAYELDSGQLYQLNWVTNELEAIDEGYLFDSQRGYGVDLFEHSGVEESDSVMSLDFSTPWPDLLESLPSQAIEFEDDFSDYQSIVSNGYGIGDNWHSGIQALFEDLSHIINDPTLADHNELLRLYNDSFVISNQLELSSEENEALNYLRFLLYRCDLEVFQRDTNYFPEDDPLKNRWLKSYHDGILLAQDTRAFQAIRALEEHLGYGLGATDYNMIEDSQDYFICQPVITGTLVVPTLHYYRYNFDTGVLEEAIDKPENWEPVNQVI